MKWGVVLQGVDWTEVRGQVVQVGEAEAVWGSLLGRAGVGGLSGEAGLGVVGVRLL